jgi:hypothetical protein
LAAVLVAIACAGDMAASARAETYTVGTTEDLTGTCQAPASGTCSLRQLITYENGLAETPNPPDTIKVPAPAGVAFYDLANGVLTIFRSLSIVGAGARVVSIDQFSSTADRVFFVEPDPRTKAVPTVKITGLSIGFGHANSANGLLGGDILNEGTLTLNEDEISNGTATEGSGGGISNNGGTLTVTHSLVSNNFSTNLPGGAGGDTGGIQNTGPNPVTGEAGKLNVNNSTISGNVSVLGGGIVSEGDTSNTTSITNSTIVNNNGGSSTANGGGLLAKQGTITVRNSIVALNDIDEPLSGEPIPSNCGKSGISSLGYNLESAADCGFTATGDIQNTDPQFMTNGPQDNGGNTDTFALKASSPALDAIPSSAPNCTSTDQRNIARPQGAGCDIGAYELFQPVEGKQFSEVVGAASPREGTTPTINWGDGTQPSTGTLDANTRQLTGTHTYTEEGVYHASFTYINSDGTPETHPFDVKVQDAPLTASGIPVDATAGVPFTGGLATFTDADPNGEVLDYTATINWGDGSATAGSIGAVLTGGFAVTASHTYMSPGAYQTSVTITDFGGSTAMATGTANVVALPIAPPTLLPGSAPSVTTTTSASFTTTVNPHGLATQVHFEYGPVLGGAKAAAITYDSVTPDQSVVADFADHTVTAAVAGLLPNVTYHVRAVASNSAGGTQGADQTFRTPADPPPPPPVLDKTANVEPVSGEVFIKLPPGGHISSVTPIWSAVESLSKGVGFIPLTEARQIPIGSTLDTTGGVAQITTATTASKKGKLQSGDFGAGLFKLLQNRRQRGLTELDILNVRPRQVCASTGKARAAVKSKHLSNTVLGRLNSNDHGKFATRGQYSAATVRGTVYSVINECVGTLTEVNRGLVSVRDFARRKTITLHAGGHYLAKAPH